LRDQHAAVLQRLRGDQQIVAADRLAFRFEPLADGRVMPVDVTVERHDSEDVE
jgi:hypothetical protein